MPEPEAVPDAPAPQPEPEPEPVVAEADGDFQPPLEGRGRVESLDEPLASIALPTDAARPDSDAGSVAYSDDSSWSAEPGDAAVAAEPGAEPAPEQPAPSAHQPAPAAAAPAPDPVPAEDEPAGSLQPPASPHTVRIGADVLRERFQEIPSPFARAALGDSPDAVDPIQPAQDDEDEEDEDDDGWIDHGETGIAGDAQEQVIFLNAPEPLGHRDTEAFFASDETVPDADDEALPDADAASGSGAAPYEWTSPGDAASESATSTEDSTDAAAQEAAAAAVSAAEQIATPPQSPDIRQDAHPAQPDANRILEGIQGQQREMQMLQSTLANAASEQAARQHLLIEQQLAWYRQQQEQQQRQLEQVQEVSQRMLTAESELTQSKIQTLTDAQQRLGLVTSQPAPMVGPRVESTIYAQTAAGDSSEPLDQAAARNPSGRQDIIDHAADEARRTSG